MTRRPVSRGTIDFLPVLLGLLVVIAIAASRPAPRPTAAGELVDVSELARGASGPELSEAPHVPGPVAGLQPRAGRPNDVASPTPPAAPVPSPAGITSQPLELVTYDGIASWMPERYGRDYLAMREPRGTIVEICGAGGCVTRKVIDYGPSKRLHPNRIADLSAHDFVEVCGAPLSVGLCNVVATIQRRPPRITLPPTDGVDE